MTQAESSPQEPPPLVLLVDKDDDTREILRDALEYHGYRVLSSSEGELGLGLAHRHRPAVIIGDFPLDVPGHSPFVGDIRRNPALDRTRILVVTARAMEHELKAAQAVGDAVLLKPVDPAAVVAEVVRLTSPSNPSSQ